MATVKVKRRHTTGGTASIVDGELSVNSFDKKIFIGNGSTAVEIANQLGYSTIATVGTITTGTWNANTIATLYGGTGLTSFTSGGLVYASSTSALTTGTVFDIDSTANSYRINIASGATPKTTQEFKVSETAFNSSAAIGVYTDVSDNPPGSLGQAYVNLTSTTGTDSQIILSSGSGSVTFAGGATPLSLTATPSLWGSGVGVLYCIDDAIDPYIIFGDDGTNNSTSIIITDTLSAMTVTATTLQINTSTPAVGEFLECLDSSGTTAWARQQSFRHLTGGTGDNLKYLHCDYCTGGTASASAASNTLVYYIPFTIYGPGNTSVKAALQSTSTTVGASPGTVTVKIYGASDTTGNPTGSSLYDLGTITLTNSTNTAFIGDTTVSLPPGHYWIGYKFSASVPVLRRVQIEQGRNYRTAGGEVRSGTNYVFHAFTETVASGSTAPSSVGTITEVNSTSLNTTIPSIYLQVQ
jgi:hypothetical protein